MSVKINKSLDDGLVLYVPMDEGSGSTGFDRSKNSHNAVVPSDIWEVDAEKGVVPHFNNLASKNLDIPASTAFDLQEQTVSFWFKIDAIDGLNVTVFGHRKDDTNWMFYRGSGWADKQLGFYRYYMGTDLVVHSVLNRTLFEIDTWYHVVMVLYADGKSKEYINGVLAFDNAIPADFDYWETSTYKYYTSMQGYLKDVRIYNRALSSDEVSALYRLGVTKNLSDGLVLYLPLNEGSGTTVYDKSKYGHNGTVNGATWTEDTDVGECLDFDGVNDNVVISGFTQGRDTPESFTVSMWLKNNMEANPSNTFLIKPGGVGSSYWSLSLDNQKTLSFYLQDGTGSGITTTTLNTNEWLHLVCVFKSGVAMRIYINGSLVKSSATSRVGVGSENTRMLSLGTIGWMVSNNYYWKGEMKDLRIYNRALSYAEISALYRLTKKGVE